MFAGSEKENAKATYKGGVGFAPNLATCDNTDDVLVVDPRPGNATSNCAADNVAALDLAVSRLPGAFRRRLLVRLDGAGFSHELLEHIASGGGKRGRCWEFSVGWSCTDVEMDAIARVPKEAWQAGIDQDGEVADDTFVAELTGLLDLDAWHEKIPGLRVLVRDEPLHPRYRTRASEREKRLGRRYQLVAVNATVGQIAWLDARHRSHVHVESRIRCAKETGLRRLPSQKFTINRVWCVAVGMACDLLAWMALLALDGDLAKAEPKTVRYRLLHTAGRIVLGQRRRRLRIPATWPWADALATAFTRILALPQPG